MGLDYRNWCNWGVVLEGRVQQLSLVLCDGRTEGRLGVGPHLIMEFVRRCFMVR